MRYRKRSILCTEGAHEQVELLATTAVMMMVVVQLSRLVFIRRLRFLR
ncbi:MAG: hypothetical protein IT420_00985 [Candidatus Brocadia sp.]|nr:hypothetical protein [Candidatus Brocadia sp.]